MRPGDVSSGAAQLATATGGLDAAGRQAREHWNDANSLAFEQDEILPLMQSIKLALEATQLYGSAVRQAHHICDPEARNWLGD